MGVTRLDGLGTVWGGFPCTNPIGGCKQKLPCISLEGEWGGLNFAAICGQIPAYLGVYNVVSESRRNF